MKINLGELYEGEWPHPFEMGIGLEFSGNPSNHNEFIQVLAEFSCNAVAAKRILLDMMVEGQRKVTVMPYIDFPLVVKKLNDLGVDVKIIEPANHSTPQYFKNSARWDNEIVKILHAELDFTESLKDKMPLERRIFQERYDAAKLGEALLIIKVGSPN